MWLLTLTGSALRQTGRESLSSWFEQSLVARQKEMPAFHAGPAFEASIIWDEARRGGHAAFAGANKGVLADDMTGQGCTADVTRFDYTGVI
jgi:beta-xylosidase